LVSGYAATTADRRSIVALVYQISYRSGSVDIGTLMDNLRRAIMATMDRLSAVVAA
jgi:hypothetical protein